jgi:hypothetical protein
VRNIFHLIHDMELKSRQKYKYYFFNNNVVIYCSLAFTLNMGEGYQGSGLSHHHVCLVGFRGKMNSAKLIQTFP